MSRKSEIVYTGESLRNENKKVDGKDVFAYLPESKLVEAVNLSIVLERPLLIMGEPGCGKTRLAESVAYELHKEDMSNKYFRWNVKSTSKAKDGLYVFKALKHFQDSHADRLKDYSDENILKEYIQDGPLGKAIRICKDAKDAKEMPPVVLIDEIDKASLDFPNDLLYELEQMSFEYEELSLESNLRTVETRDLKPIVLITSNNEKELPAAFLRRCIFYEIAFPGKKELRKIVHSRFENADSTLVSDTVDAFLRVRKKLETTDRVSDKKVSTSELIDWFEVIQHYHNKQKSNKLTGPETELVKELDKLKLEEGLPPFYQVLLKDTSWIDRFKK